MKFVKYIMALLVLNVFTFADIPFDILPFDQYNISMVHLLEFQETLKISFEKTEKYISGLTPEVSAKLHAKYVTKDNIQNQTWDQNRQLLDLCKKAGLQRLIGGRITFNGTTYSILLKIYDLREDKIVFSETLFHYTTFENLINYNLFEMIDQIVDPPETVTSGLVYNLAGQAIITENQLMFSPCLSMGLKAKTNVFLTADFGVPVSDAPWYVGLNVRKVQAKYITYSLGMTYISEQKDNFDYLSLYNAPEIEQVLEMEHYPGLHLSCGFRFPIMANLSLISEIGVDAFYCDWQTLDLKKESGFLYQIRPAITLYYHIPMNTENQFSY